MWENNYFFPSVFTVPFQQWAQKAKGGLAFPDGESHGQSNPLNWDVTEQEKKATTCQEQKGAVALLLSPSHMATGKTSSTMNESCFKRHAKED